MMYGLEMVARTKVQEADLEVAEQKILRFSLGEMNTSEGQLGSSGLEIK